MGGVAWRAIGLHGVVWRNVVWYGVAWGLEWNGVEARGGGVTSLSGSSAPQAHLPLRFPESVSEGFSFSRSSTGVRPCGWHLSENRK